MSLIIWILKFSERHFSNVKRSTVGTHKHCQRCETEAAWKHRSSLQQGNKLARDVTRIVMK